MSDHYRRTFKNYVIKPLNWIGSSYLRPGNFITGRTVAIWSAVSASMVSLMYTMVVKDTHTKMKCTTVVSVATQGCSKFYVLYRHSKTLRGKYEYLMNLFEKCEHLPREAAKLCAWQGIMNFFVRGFAFMMILNMLGFSLTPLYLYYVKGVMEVPLPMYIPFVDDTTPSGYFVTTSFQLTILTIAVLGTVGFDLTMLLLLMGVCMMTDVIMLKLVRLSEGLRDGGPQTANQRETRDFLHNVVRMTVEFCGQLDSLADMFYATFIFEIGLDSLSMCLILFVLTQLNWLPLYVYFLCFIMKAFFACIMGTMISIYCDKLYEAFERFPWYMLAMGDRWKYIIVLNRLQSPTLLMCGTLEMNMELFVSVMRNAYTVAMMLNGLSE